MPQHKADGFTLIEMIVVLVVLGLVVGLAIEHGPSRSQRLDLDGAVQKVTGLLRLARSRAIAQERPVAVTFGAAGYRLDGEAPVAWSADVSTVSDVAIDFTPDGGSSGGRVVLRGGNREIVVGVDWLTGHVLTR